MRFLCEFEWNDGGEEEEEKREISFCGRGRRVSANKDEQMRGGRGRTLGHFGPFGRTTSFQQLRALELQ